MLERNTPPTSCSPMNDLLPMCLTMFFYGVSLKDPCLCGCLGYLGNEKLPHLCGESS